MDKKREALEGMPTIEQLKAHLLQDNDSVVDPRAVHPARQLKPQVLSIIEEIACSIACKRSIDELTAKFGQIGSEAERRQWAKQLVELQENAKKREKVDQAADHLWISVGQLGHKIKKYSQTSTGLGLGRSWNNISISEMFEKLFLWCEQDNNVSIDQNQNTDFGNVLSPGLRVEDDKLLRKAFPLPQFVVVGDDATTPKFNRLCVEKSIEKLSNTKLTESGGRFDKAINFLGLNRTADLLVSRVKEALDEEYSIVSIKKRILTFKLSKAKAESANSPDGSLQQLRQRLQNDVEAFMERLTLEQNENSKTKVQEFSLRLDEEDFANEKSEAFIERVTLESKPKVQSGNADKYQNPFNCDVPQKPADATKDFWRLKASIASVDGSSTDPLLEVYQFSNDTARDDNIKEYKQFLSELTKHVVQAESNRVASSKPDMAESQPDTKFDETYASYCTTDNYQKTTIIEFETGIVECFSPEKSIAQQFATLKDVRKPILKEASLSNFTFNNRATFGMILKNATAMPARLFAAVFILFAPLVLFGFGNLSKELTKGIGGGSELDPLLGLTAMALGAFLVSVTILIAWIFEPKKWFSERKLRGVNFVWVRWPIYAIVGVVVVGFVNLTLSCSLLQPIEKSEAWRITDKHLLRGNDSNEFTTLWRELTLTADENAQPTIETIYKDQFPDLPTALTEVSFNFKSKSLRSLSQLSKVIGEMERVAVPPDDEKLLKVFAELKESGYREDNEEIEIHFSELQSRIARLENGSDGAMRLLLAFMNYINVDKTYNWMGFQKEVAYQAFEKCDSRLAITRSLYFMLARPSDFWNHPPNKAVIHAVGLAKLKAFVASSDLEKAVKDLGEMGLTLDVVGKLINKFQLEDEIEPAYRQAKRKLLLLESYTKFTSVDISKYFSTDRFQSISSNDKSEANRFLFRFWLLVTIIFLVGILLLLLGCFRSPDEPHYFLMSFASISLSLLILLSGWSSYDRHSDSNVKSWSRQLLADQSETIELSTNNWFLDSATLHLFQSWDPKSKEMIEREAFLIPESGKEYGRKTLGKFDPGYSVWPCLVLVGVLTGCFFWARAGHQRQVGQQITDANRFFKQALETGAKKAIEEHQRSATEKLRRLLGDWLESTIAKESADQKQAWRTRQNKCAQKIHSLASEIGVLDARDVERKEIRRCKEVCQDAIKSLRDETIKTLKPAFPNS